ncbi:hypothetical protein [Amycolatopsis albispora]|uniref:Uncharacterized protein n=1 Tax=Amycolatopsis albispora TaxID=1804986 RepID=A0A344L4T3_9PSEU|nr:hypothetical protein [Amycolatopsis albispora]AXB43057.1 hypothetical protein A4R43_11270 [Amycolatopsis albispora]
MENAESPAEPGTTRSQSSTTGTRTPPTAPCTVVWSLGRPYVLENNARWVGTDRRGRPQVLTRAELQRRGWSYRRAG